MPDHRLKLEELLTAENVTALDDSGRNNQGKIGVLAVLLKQEFGLVLETDPDIVAGFAVDSSNLKGTASGVARPANAREAAAVLRGCFAAGIPVTVSAGKSNLTGSATPPGGVVLSTVNMVQPAVAVDAANRLVTVPVGIVLEQMREEVRRQSGGTLLYPVDPTSRGDAFVGGTIACNASGFVPGEKGATRDWIHSLDFILPDGRMVRVKRGEYVSCDGAFALGVEPGAPAWPVPRYRRPAIKNAGGPFSAPDGAMDLIDLVAGSEGIFGLVTGATLKLVTKPEATLNLFFSLAGEEQALGVYRHMVANLPEGLGVLGAFEYFGVNCRKYMDHENVFFKGNDQVALYVQIPIAGRELEDVAGEWLEMLLNAECGVAEASIMMLDDDRSWKLFMEARHSLPAKSLEVVQRRGTYTIMTDTVVPPDRFPEFLDYTHSLLKKEGLDYVSFGHFGDCHLHFTILPEKTNLARATEVYDLIVARSAELGGVYSGEHGTGKRKRKDFLRCYGQAAVEDVLRCKRAVDPGFILNRDNVVECPPLPQGVWRTGSSGTGQ